MKKLGFLLSLSFLLYTVGYAQTAGAKAKASLPQIKADIAAKMQYNPQTGNILTASITNRLIAPLQLNASQQQSMNSALNDFFVAKTPYWSLKGNNDTEYAQQESALLSVLITKISGFLSADQVSKFQSLKPAADKGSDVLVLVFY